LDLVIEPAQLCDRIISFVAQNGSESDLLLPLRERIDPKSEWYLARSGDAIVGAASISYADEIARVGELCVARDRRRRGIGREMLGRMIDEARSRGYSRVMLTGVDLREEGSRGFAEAMGLRLDRDGVRMEWHPCPLPEVELPDGYELRSFREGDELAWSDLINRAYSTTPNKTEYTPQKVRENWTSTPCFMPDGSFFVTHGDDLVGCFMAWREVDAGPRRGRLHWLAVDPDHRRRGIAKYLTVKVIEHLQERGLDSIFLDTGYNLPVAMAMYRKLGFVETHRLFDYVVDLS
jgi:mycothiol synthase